jgi:hypothetical protein
MVTGPRLRIARCKTVAAAIRACPRAEIASRIAVPACSAAAWPRESLFGKTRIKMMKFALRSADFLRRALYRALIAIMGQGG